MASQNEKAICKLVKETKENWEGKDGNEMVVVVGRREPASSRSSILTFRFPRRELWLPEKEVEKIARFPDAGFSWTVLGVPRWLFEEEARTERNLYECRLEKRRSVPGTGVPIRFDKPWDSTDRSIWLHGQVAQLLSGYDRDWAADRGEIMSNGTEEVVNPIGPTGKAEIKVTVPCPDEAGEVIATVRQAIFRDLGELLTENTREGEEEVVWEATVQAPGLVR